MKNVYVSTLLILLMNMITTTNGLAKDIFATYPHDVKMKDELFYSSGVCAFRLWAPTAEAAELRLYDHDAQAGGEKARVIAMKRGVKGVWGIDVKEDLKGKYYTFRIKTDGRWLAETAGIRAKAVGINGKRAAVIDLNDSDPVGWAEDRSPALKSFTDIVIYEMHHRDFSVNEHSGIENKGKYLALTEKGTKNEAGASTGLDHLRELGVTHLHLLPSYDYGSIDESQLHEKRYNWGYDPTNYNVPEGSYSTEPGNPLSRIREFKQMVQSIHQNGMRVILDVVYNHTQTIDGSAFTLTVPGYFYRQWPDGRYSNASGCGNETASERAMVRQFIVESVKYWVNEYHVDGFRFDLMGIHDVETMKEVRKALDEIDPMLFVYGEGWTAGDSPLPEKLRAVKKNGLQLRRIAVFSDDLRDAVKGSWNDAKKGGFVCGVGGLEESVKFGIVGATQHSGVNYTRVNYSKAPYANHPGEVINYVSCHDDLCLNDKLQLASNANTTEEEIIRMNKLAQTMVFVSQGVPFIYAGEELFRTKRGIHNTFASPDSINQIEWNNKSRYAGLYDYYKKLIALRKAHPAFRMSRTEDVQKHLRFLEIHKPCVVGFALSNHANGDEWKEIVVIFNGNKEEKEIEIPQGEWQIAAADGEINAAGMGTLKGGKVKVKAISALIVFRK